jgi:hypothetical protein
MDMSRILPTFKRLRWKPTLSYTAVTVVVLLTVSAAGWLIVLLTDTPSATMDYSQSLAVAKAAEARPFLEATLPDSTLLELWLQNAITDEWFVIVSPSGEPLAANVAEAADEALLRQPFVDSNAPDESRQLIDQALIGPYARSLWLTKRPLMWYRMVRHKPTSHIGGQDHDT